MYLTRLNTLIPKYSEDLSEKSVMTVSGLDFFSIGNELVHVNNFEFNSIGINIATLIKIIQDNGGIVTEVDSDLLLFPVNIISNYSTILIKKVFGSPVNLDLLMYRFRDLDFSYQDKSGEGKIISQKYLSSKESESLIVKNVSRFKLLKNSEEYIGV